MEMTTARRIGGVCRKIGRDWSNKRPMSARFADWTPLSLVHLEQDTQNGESMQMTLNLLIGMTRTFRMNASPDRLWMDQARRALDARVQSLSAVQTPRAQWVVSLSERVLALIEGHNATETRARREDAASFGVAAQVAGQMETAAEAVQRELIRERDRLVREIERTRTELDRHMEREAAGRHAEGSPMLRMLGGVVAHGTPLVAAMRPNAFGRMEHGRLSEGSGVRSLRRNGEASRRMRGAALSPTSENVFGQEQGSGDSFTSTRISQGMPVVERTRTFGDAFVPEFGSDSERSFSGAGVTAEDNARPAATLSVAPQASTSSSFVERFFHSVSALSVIFPGAASGVAFSPVRLAYLINAQDTSGEDAHTQTGGDTAEAGRQTVLERLLAGTQGVLLRAQQERVQERIRERTMVSAMYLTLMELTQERLRSVIREGIAQERFGSNLGGEVASARREEPTAERDDATVRREEEASVLSEQLLQASLHMSARFLRTGVLRGLAETRHAPGTAEAVAFAETAAPVALRYREDQASLQGDQTQGAVGTGNFDESRLRAVLRSTMRQMEDSVSRAVVYRGANGALRRTEDMAANEENAPSGAPWGQGGVSGRAVLRQRPQDGRPAASSVSRYSADVPFANEENFGETALWQQPRNGSHPALHDGLLPASQGGTMLASRQSGLPDATVFSEWSIARVSARPTAIGTLWPEILSNPVASESVMGRLLPVALTQLMPSSPREGAEASPSAAVDGQLVRALRDALVAAVARPGAGNAFSRMGRAASGEAAAQIARGASGWAESSHGGQAGGSWRQYGSVVANASATMWEAEDARQEAAPSLHPRALRRSAAARRGAGGYRPFREVPLRQDEFAVEQEGYVVPGRAAWGFPFQLRNVTAGSVGAERVAREPSLGEGAVARSVQRVLAGLLRGALRGETRLLQAARTSGEDVLGKVPGFSAQEVRRVLRRVGVVPFLTHAAVPDRVARNGERMMGPADVVLHAALRRARRAAQAAFSGTVASLVMEGAAETPEARLAWLQEGASAAARGRARRSAAAASAEEPALVYRGGRDAYFDEAEPPLLISPKPAPVAPVALSHRKSGGRQQEGASAAPPMQVNKQVNDIARVVLPPASTQAPSPQERNAPRRDEPLRMDPRQVDKLVDQVVGRIQNEMKRERLRRGMM